jgi:hypothetical protein
MRKMKSWSFVMVLCLLTMLTAACGNGTAMKQDPKEAVAAAFKQLATYKNYHMTMDVESAGKINGTDAKSVVKSEIDFQQNPLLVKNEMNIDSENGSTKINSHILQYMEKSGDKILVYTNVNNRWLKQTLPQGDYNPLKDAENAMKSLKSVTKTSEDANVAVFEVVPNRDYVKNKIQHQLQMMGMKDVAVNDELIKAVGDLKYTVTIDKKTANITQINMDLTDFMARFGKALANLSKAPSDQKKAIEQVFSNMKVNTTIYFSNFDKVGKITIPAEAKK